MIICESCIKANYPEFQQFDRIGWSEGRCQICQVEKTVAMVPSAILEGNVDLDEGKEKPKIQRVKAKPEKKEKYKYLIIDWAFVKNNFYNPEMYRFFANKEDLIKSYTRLFLELKHQDLDVYELTSIPHKAEIKVEIGK